MTTDVLDQLMAVVVARAVEEEAGGNANSHAQTGSVSLVGYVVPELTLISMVQRVSVIPIPAEATVLIPVDD